MLTTSSPQRTSELDSQPRTSELELAARLRLAVTRLARRLRQQSGEGLSPSQNSALATVERSETLTPSELAEIERIQRPTATRILSALAEGGLLTRTPDPADGRVARVKITKHGRETLKRSRSRKNAYLARRLALLESSELETLASAAELLERLLGNDLPPEADR